MFCSICNIEARRFSKNRNGSQRYRCPNCKKTFTDITTRPIDRRCLDQGKAIMCLRMLLEGNSVRSVERLTGVHRDTIINCMIDAGEKCKTFLAEKIQNLEVEDVQCDEIWDFVFTKQKNAIRKNYGPEVGDAWCWTAIERNTKLILAWHLGKRKQKYLD